MTNFYTNEYLEKIKRQKNKLLTIYFIILAVCVLIEVVVIGFNAYLPYMHEYKTLLTIILYATGVLFTVFSFLYLQKDKIKVPSMGYLYAKRTVSCHTELPQFPPRCPGNLYVSQTDKHSDLTAKIQRSYGNGCCFGFSPNSLIP